MAQLTVATLNIRNIADRWPERLPLLLADMAALQPDVMGLQEVVFASQQDRLLGAAGEGRYESFRGWAGRPEYGNAVLVKEPLRAIEEERLDLDHRRSAELVQVALDGTGGAAPGSHRLAFVATHLHHEVPDEAIRDEQAAALTSWLDGRPGAGEEATVVVGDFNAEPVEAAYRRMLSAGFRSASVEANGREPAVTWPSGIQAPAMDTDGEPGCLDYIWVRGPISVQACRVVFDRPAVGDPTLYPSDHFGLVASITVGG
jgi:endonuclease/exonuclease/phosphatase family metal-dependent hydrolase